MISKTLPTPPRINRLFQDFCRKWFFTSDVKNSHVS